MSPRPKSAAGGPSVLSEDIISETVEEIAELCRCLTKRVRTGRHDSEFGALTGWEERVWIVNPYEGHAALMCGIM